MQFKEGDKVVRKSGISKVPTTLEEGEVIRVSPPTDNITSSKVLVKFPSYWGDNFVELTENELLPLDQAQEEQNKLEGEYKRVQELVKAQLNSAAQIIQQAVAISDKSDLYVSNFGYDVSSELFAALEEAGWNTSSIAGC